MAEFDEWVIAHRRRLHQEPEVSHAEYRTRRYVQQQLEALGIAHATVTGKDVVGRLVGDRPGPTVAVRADMDGLSVTETTGLPFAATNGVMHACGHDGHMAIVLGVARLFAEAPEFAGEVRFVFQHAEEAMPGGAREIVDAGGVDDIDAMLGCHLWQPVETGVVGFAEGVTMAGIDGFEVTISGRGGHGSTPESTIDPVLMAATFVTQAHTIISRSVAPAQSAVLSIGSIAAGENYNVVPDKAFVSGSVRYFDSSVAETIKERLAAVLEGVTRSYGGSGTLDYVRGDPPLVNDSELLGVVVASARDQLGDDRVSRISPVLGSEDFAYYAQRIPAAYVFVGVGGPERAAGHHSAAFDIAEDVLAPTARLLHSAAQRVLASPVRR